MLRVAVGQAYLAFGISNLLSVNMPSQSTATVTVMLFLVVAQLCSGVDMISYKDMRHALLGVPWQTVSCATRCVKRLPSNCSCCRVHPVRPAKAGHLIFILSPSFYTVQRFLPIMLNEGMTPPVKDAVCKGYLRQKGVVCDRPEHNLAGTLHSEMSDSDGPYIFLSSDMQLVMLGIALRAISLLQLQLRAVGLRGSPWELCLRGLVLVNAALFYLLTISQTYN